MVWREWDKLKAGPLSRFFDGLRVGHVGFSSRGWRNGRAEIAPKAHALAA